MVKIQIQFELTYAKIDWIKLFLFYDDDWKLLIL